MIGTSEDGYAYLESLLNTEKHRLSPESREYRLDRMAALLGRYDNPHFCAPVIHVGGTKGKGSTAALAASVLSAAGEKVGVYASPHVSSYDERITINGAPIPEDLVIRQVRRFERDIESGALGLLVGDAGPTTFEMLTLLAFLAFQELGCTWMVIEVGIGGRLDCTNVVNPAVSIITPLDLEHTQLLGGTITSIAREKGGIIKPGRPVFSAAQPEEARECLKEISRDRNTTITFVDEATIVAEAVSDRNGTDVRLVTKDGVGHPFRVSLPGRFQAENAALAYLAVRSARPGITEQEAALGFRSASLPGRMEVLGDSPAITLDGAHTPLAVSRALETWRELFQGPGILLFGSVEGKNAEEMARILAGEFRDIIVSTPGTFKPSHPEEVTDAFRRHNGHVRLIVDPADALRKALDLAGGTTPILVTGSFYMLGEIRGLVLDDDYS